jgi:hypothetical protein
MIELSEGMERRLMGMVMGEVANYMQSTAVVSKRAKLTAMQSIAGYTGGKLARTTHSGEREMDTVLGRTATDAATFGVFMTLYQRDPVANALINKPVGATWRRPPQITDGDAADTPFCMGWKQLVKQKKIWTVFPRLDRLAMLGKYAILLIGFSDVKSNADLATPVKEKQFKRGLEDVYFLRPYGQDQIKKVTMNVDPASRRYGLPEIYTIIENVVASSEQAAQPNEIEVHWSRIIHAADSTMQSGLEGIPFLLPILDDLEDLAKTIGGAAESVWRASGQDIVMAMNEGYEFPTEAAREEFTEQLRSRVNQLVRSVITTGGTPQIVHATAVDPTGVVEAIYKRILSYSSIPGRIMFGSEAGRLASDQDEGSWAAHIAARQVEYAEDSILRPFIDQMIYTGVLPVPTSKEGYNVGTYDQKLDAWIWPSIEEPNEMEKAEIADKRASAMQKAADVAAVNSSLDDDDVRGFGGLPPREEEA